MLDAGWRRVAWWSQVKSFWKSQKASVRTGIICTVACFLLLFLVIIVSLTSGRKWPLPNARYLKLEGDDFTRRFKNLQEEQAKRISGDTSDGKKWKRLAIVVPFLQRQLDYLLFNFKLWSCKFSPCGDGIDEADKPDLILYISTDWNSGPEERLTWNKLQKAIDSSPFRKCFGEIIFHGSHMPPELDNYVYGPPTQFYRLLSIRSLDEYSLYEYIYQMEPDCIPIKGNWIQAIHEAINVSEAGFWVKGSAPRYADAKTYPSHFVLHINGNAIFAYTNPLFVEYVNKTRYYWINNKGYSLDLGLYGYLLNEKAYEYAHRFIFSEFVQNRQNEEIDIPSLASATHLVHGKGAVQTLKKEFSFSFTTDVDKAIACS